MTLPRPRPKTTKQNKQNVDFGNQSPATPGHISVHLRPGRGRRCRSCYFYHLVGMTVTVTNAPDVKIILSLLPVKHDYYSGAHPASKLTRMPPVKTLSAEHRAALNSRQWRRP